VASAVVGVGLGGALSPEDFESLIARLEGLMQEAVSHEEIGWQAEGALFEAP
jgi:hypothetical protein